MVVGLEVGEPFAQAALLTPGVILRNFSNCTKSIRNKVKLSLESENHVYRISDDTNKSITFHLDPSQFSRHLSRHLFTRF